MQSTPLIMVKMYCKLHEDDWRYGLLTIIIISMERIISVAEHKSEHILSSIHYVMFEQKWKQGN